MTLLPGTMKPSFATDSRNQHSHHPNQDFEADMDDSVDTTASNIVHEPLHLTNHNNTISTVPTVATRMTATGEATSEGPSKNITTTVPGGVGLANYDNKSYNEIDVTLTCRDVDDDDDYGHHDDDYNHVRSGYVHRVNDYRVDEDAVSVLSDDKVFDHTTLSPCYRCRIRNNRYRFCIQVLICIGIITSIIVAGVCSSGKCGNSYSKNATSSDRLCDNYEIPSPSFVPLPTSCQPPPSRPSSTPLVPTSHYTINSQKAFTSTQELYDAVDEYFETGISNPIYGHTIGSWNISLLTNLSNVFNAFDRNPLALYFNESLTGWDTSRVTTMEKLFFDARSFNGNISTWQTGNVVNMLEMFSRAVSFNGDISNWDVSKVTTIARMFGRVTNFNGNFHRWNVSSVKDMSFAFTNCFSFQGLGLDAWDTSNVQSMEGMFLNTPSFNGDLSLWNVSMVTTMRKMFRQATSFNGVLSRWDVSRVTDLTEMFMHALSFNADISSWNVSSVEKAPMTFYAASSFRTDLSGWDVSHMKDVTKMFAAAKNQDNSYCQWGQTLPADAITQSMFIASGCPNPIDSYHDSSIDRLTYCTTCSDFLNFTDVPTLSPVLDLIFPTGINGSFLPILDQAELFQAVDAYFENGMSSHAVQQYGYPIGSWDVSHVTNFSYTFAIERNIKAGDFNEDIGQWNTSSAVSMSYMFAGARSFNQSLSSWSTGKVANMSGMFMGADLFNGDLSLWDTSSVTDMSTMFQSALTYKGIGLSNWYTSSVTNLLATFEEAVSFAGNITTWDTSKVIDLQRTFQYASSFNGDISRWNVSLVKCFSYAFSGASSFNRDLSSWDVSSAHSMIGMFSSAKAFNKDLCSWGSRLNVSIVPTGNLTRGMFTSSACLATRDPSIVNVSQGPFCRDCLT